jgi:hypothetical protein
MKNGGVYTRLQKGMAKSCRKLPHKLLLGKHIFITLLKDGKLELQGDGCSSSCSLRAGLNSTPEFAEKEISEE